MKKKIKYYIKVLVWRVMKRLPQSIRGPLMRSQFKIKLPQGIYKDIEYKVAETREEYEQAFELVQSSYLATDISNERDAIYRLSKYNILPTTTTFIAKYEGKVIATVSQITDTALGLPIESISDISRFRKSGKRICEFSSLAVDSEWRSRSEGVFLPLVLYAVLFCKRYVGIEVVTIVTRATVRHFYQSIFMFEPIDDKIQKYGSVNDIESYTQYLDLNFLFPRVGSVYKSNQFNRNLYLVLKSFPWESQCYWPKKKYNLSTDQAFSAEDLDYFFNHKVNLFSTLTKQDLSILKSIYHYDNFKQIISPTNQDFINQRSHPRFQVHMKVYYKKDKSMQMARIQEVSQDGFSVLFEDASLAVDDLEGTILLNGVDDCAFAAKRCWNNGVKSGYFFLTKDNKQWDKFISYSHEVMGNNTQLQKSFGDEVA